MPAGTKVTTLQAVDMDGTSPNNIVYYDIELPRPDNDGGFRKEKKGSETFDATKYFSIDRNTGEIFTKVEFDREERQSYTIPVVATDGAPSDINPGKGNAPNSGK